MSAAWAGAVIKDDAMIVAPTVNAIFVIFFNCESSLANAFVLEIVCASLAAIDSWPASWLAPKQRGFPQYTNGAVLAPPTLHLVLLILISPALVQPYAFDSTG